MKLLLTVSAILFCFIFSKVNAQQNSSYGSINGSILDTISHNLSFASISLLNPRDSSVVKRTLSDTAGQFTFSKVAFGDYVLRVSYQGFDVREKEISLSQGHPHDSLPPIILQESVNELGTVVVTAIIPVKMNGDTTEYNADAYGVKPNAVVEDLLKKLPGVEVDDDGNITAQGEKVARIFVDGKRFFGNDPKMATQNLPTEVVEKIQVFDGKTDQSEFTGFDDGNTIKTINIVTKKNKRKGWFGKSSAAVGNDEASLNNLFYDAHARVFRFMGDRRISLVGAFNKTYKQPFAMDIGGGQNGLSKKISGAINYRDNFGKKTDFTGSYSYDNSDNISASQSYTQRLFQNDTTQNTSQVRTSNNSSQNHAVNLNWDTKFDTLNELRIRADVNFSNGRNSGTTNSFIDRMINGADSTAISKTFTKNSRTNSGGNAAVGITFRHRFFKPGRTISINNNLSTNSGNASGLNYSDIFSYLSDSASYTNQLFNAHNNSKSISTTLAYTEPIAVHQLIQFEINNSVSENTSDRRTYNFDSATMQYTLADSILTNKYDNIYQSNRATLSYLYNNGIINFNAGTGVQLGNLKSNNLSKDLFLTQHYVNLYPTASFSYRISQYKRLRFNYHGRTNQPNVQQLQPVIDNSNPLNIVSGNPDLKQEFNNTFLLRYTNINKETNNTFFAMLNGSFTKNNIVNSITRLSNGGDSSIPVNLNGNYSVSGYVNWGFSLASP
ncbi:outer membrane beta-barrel protein, partial [Arachidicoccus sp.]|uniref:outer membrane beta-barrel protein n=1 Tax=Arachidicoccus sp. TaxID=1872624 RepID=UPI003D23F278